MTSRTVFLSRLFGLYLILYALTMAVHWQAKADIVIWLLHNPPILWMMGLFALVAGLAMVLVHNRWSGGVRVVIVTIVGWMALAKGFFFLCVPSGAAVEWLVSVFARAGSFYALTAAVFVLGLIFTLNGFLPESQTQK